MNVFTFYKGVLKFLFFAILVIGCNSKRDSRRVTAVDGSRDLQHILEEKVLVAVTDFNSTNYFIYKGEPMGFQFDLLQAYAQHIGVRLELITENNLDNAFKMLENGEVDVFANNLTVTGKRSEIYKFTIPHSTTRQVLVQRKRDRGDSDTDLIRNPLELANRIVYVQEGSASAHRLKNLSDEIGASIVIVEMGNYEADELIELVAQGEINYTVCDEDIARVNSFFYENIDVETALSFDQNLAWAVGKQSPDLLASLNEWLQVFTKTAEYRIIKGKYFENPFWARRILSENLKIRSYGQISPFDDRFKNASSSIDWDWRLFASLVYQESRFRHNVQSHRGAYGLMQFMPSTADFFGVSHKPDPDTQIKAGAKYLKWLEKRFPDIEDSQERIKFILASYNGGLGHVLDAQNLARKHGKNPYIWDDNVDFFILNKSNPDYYCDTTVRYGYFRGVETYNYVKEIMQRYKHYQNILPE